MDSVGKKKTPKTYYRKCAFQGCMNTMDENPLATYHLFPRNERLRQLWLEAADNPALFTLPYTRLRNTYSVCSEHFTCSQFQTHEKKKLLRGAIPKKRCTDFSEPSTSGLGDVTVVAETPLESPIQWEETESLERENPSNIGTRSRVRTNLLRSIGIKSQKQLTPRKRALFKTVVKKKKLVKYYAKKLKNCSKDLFGVKKLLKNGDILNSTALMLFENLTPSAKLFIKSQLTHKGKSARQFRWNAEEKSFYLALQKTSPKCYRFLRQVFNLPSPRTLQRTLNSLHINAGINDSIFTHIANVSSRMKETKRFCCLVFDEVALLPHLDFNMQLKNIVGLEDFGNEKTKFIADHALVFMLKGINAFWKQPVAYFFVKSGVKTGQLKKLIKEIIEQVHARTSFKILATVSDQGSSNVAAISNLSRESGYPNDFIFLVDDVKIHHIFDAPHLLKGVRNNFLNKNIVFDNEVAKWSDIVELYNYDGLANPDGKLCVKLTEDHVYPKGKQKMKVKLAAQIFSRSVYAALSFASNIKVMNAQGTAKFVLFMNKLFDSLNGIRRSNKPLNGPLSDKSHHFEFWAEAKPFLNSLKFMSNNEITRSPPSVKHLIATIRNFQSLWKIMKSYGFKFLLTRSVNQDCLENTFGVLRGLCGQNPRPTPYQFAAAFKTCLINNLVANSNSKNCEDDGSHFVIGLLNTFCSQQHEENDVTQNKELEVSNVTTNRDTNAPVIISLNNINVNKLLRTNTTAYIAGYICKKILKQDCKDCTNYFVTSTITDIHTFVNLKDYTGSKLFYASKELIELIDIQKRIIFENFINIIHSNNLVDSLKDMINIHFSFCPEHDCYNARNIKSAIVYIMLKYIILQINRKLGKKDLRPNNILDTYIKNYCSDIR